MKTIKLIKYIFNSIGRLKQEMEDEEFEEMMRNKPLTPEEILFKTRKEEKVCVNCGSKDVTYEEHGPDLGHILYCSKTCYNKFMRKWLHRGYIYEIKELLK